MAVKYKDLQKVLDDKPLSSEETFLIAELEDYIDDEIRTNFNGRNTKIEIGLEYAHFNKDIKNNTIDYPQERKEKKIKKLTSLSEDAGWEIEIDWGEDDGPNRPAFDYWVLTPKR